MLVAFKRFPVIKFPLFMCLVPWILTSGILAVGKITQEQVRARLARRDNLSSLRHPDLLQPVTPYTATPLKDESELRTDDWIVAQANSLMVGALGPVTNAITSAVIFLCASPEKMERLKQEVRNAFSAYTDITAEALQSSCPYLNAVIDEDLRLMTPAPSGLPRFSPGAHVDGYFVPAGVTVQTCNFATAHSPESFFLPREFHPERHLDANHMWYDARFSGDDKHSISPFSIGPRRCPGSGIAYLQMRLIIAKLAWALDIEFSPSNNLQGWDTDVRVYSTYQFPSVWIRCKPPIRASLA
ncbi:Isotrichodermin C-15 hydroxylase 2 [Colletotrichum chlorophyti]|uniref:Isotrichodermin C-15 hydroxylase 2 n=1 Tax=Colletotrichum chlorophyti TaxID=708187 RepID=A0A1Q8RVH0_9PEZI|nr:Isotrichodermin C-15 hydroxylase 2 [Colletotrichum chlorophyti]